MVKKTPAYKNRLRALELERSGGTTNKKKSNKQMDKYEYRVILQFRNCSYVVLIFLFEQSVV